MPPRTSRRRTRSGARPDIAITIKNVKRKRTEAPEVLSLATLPMPERPPNVVWVDDRYMRRKNREYMHAVHAAQQAIEAEQVTEQQTLATQDTMKEKDKEGLVPKEIAQEERREAHGYDWSLEAKELLVLDAQETKQRVTQVNPVIAPKKSRGRLEVASPVREIVETGLKENELMVSDSAAAFEQQHTFLVRHSPEVSVHSPKETWGQHLHQLIGIDPTPEKRAPLVTLPKRTKKDVVAREIAQSSSSASTRKRMISFSPERASRPEQRALAWKKREKNLKTNEILQQRLKAPTAVKASAPVHVASPTAASLEQRPTSYLSPQARRLIPFTSPPARQTMACTSPNGTFTSPSHRLSVFQSPYTAVSGSSRLSQTEEVVYDSKEKRENFGAGQAGVGSPTSVLVENPKFCSTQEDDGAGMQSLEDDVGFSQESISIGDSHVELLHNEAAIPAAQSNTTSSAFTSTSVIDDVGLFNCEADVEYTGGVYGEGTDGKVTAAVINGQKIALKRAKPHDGLTDHEAKHRAALELYYLRRVRHTKGFLQCLGLCDAIEHTCIALEVMDCKLSDYLRRYGVNSEGSKHRRYTLSFDDTKAMLKQICLPMITLHEEINVAHGDLACRNILLRTPPEGYEQSWKPELKLSDFGRIKLPSEEPNILDTSFSFHKNCDVGAFGRDILYRLLVGEIVPKEYVETRSLHTLLQDVTVTHVPDAAKARLGPFYTLFMRCTAWGVRPTFREIYDHLNELEYFETTENGLFPLKPTGSTDATFLSPGADATRSKTPTSSASRVYQRHTPKSQIYRPTGSKSRLFASKSFTEASVPGLNKPVHWLKTRSVGVQRTIAQQALTPTAHSFLIKKKKPSPSAGASAGASRRSLQILTQIQHRTTEKGRKSN